jgi:hypothetical protein
MPHPYAGMIRIRFGGSLRTEPLSRLLAPPGIVPPSSITGWASQVNDPAVMRRRKGDRFYAWWWFAIRPRRHNAEGSQFHPPLIRDCYRRNGKNTARLPLTPCIDYIASFGALVLRSSQRGAGSKVQLTRMVRAFFVFGSVSFSSTRPGGTGPLRGALARRTEPSRTSRTLTMVGMADSSREDGSGALWPSASHNATWLTYCLRLAR